MGKKAVGTFSMKGRKGMTIIHKNNTTTAYQNVAAWTNTIDLTDFMRGQTEKSVALLLAKQKYEENNAYCRTWTAHWRQTRRWQLQVQSSARETWFLF